MLQEILGGPQDYAAPVTARHYASGLKTMSISGF